MKIWQVQKGKGCLLAQTTPLSASFPEIPHTLLLTCHIWPHQDERKIRKHSWVHFTPNKTRVLVPKEQRVHGCWVETSRCFHRNPIRLFLQPFKEAALHKSVPLSSALSSLCDSSLPEMLECFPTFLLGQLLVLFLPCCPCLFCFLYVFILFPELSTLLGAQPSAYFIG